MHLLIVLDEITPKQNDPPAGPSRLVQDHAKRKVPLGDNIHHNPLQFAARKQTVWYAKDKGAPKVCDAPPTFRSAHASIVKACSI